VRFTGGTRAPDVAFALAAGSSVASEAGSTSTKHENALETIPEMPTLVSQSVAENFYQETIQAPKSPFDLSLRPPLFSEFQGQARVKERLELMVAAAKQRGDVLEHILLSGPPGLGKTSLAFILANSMGVNIKSTSGPIIEKAGDLAGLLTTLERGDILFIDEIHRLQPAIEEYLYPAMEDFRLDIIIDQGPNARSVRLNLPKFTLIGATTRAGLISSPLRSRFGMNSRLDYYSVEELTNVIDRSAGLIGVTINKEGAREIAARSRGTPRISNNLLRWVRDYAQVKADGAIDQNVADLALKMLDIDNDGLDEMDKRLLEALITRFQGGPVGLNSLAVSVGEDAGTIEEVNEPYLIQEGYLQRTAQGRVALPKAYKKLGLERSSQGQKELF
jgi:holliday junction DNA helicase RuvB